MTDDIGEDMQAAITQLEGEAAETPAAEPAPAPAALELEPAAAADTDVETEEKPKPEGRESNGRFAKKDGLPKEPVVTTKPVLPTARPGEKPAAPAAQELRPPQSLKPAEREAFKAWPKEAQAALLRRDKEAAYGMQQLAEPARYGQQMMQALQPHAQTIQAMGGNAIAVIDSVLKTAQVMNFGTEMQRAQTLINMARNAGVSLDAMNAVLEGGGAPQQRQSQQQPQVDPAQLEQYFRSRGFLTREDVQQQRQQMHSQQATNEVSQFAEEHEFFHDVRSTMSHLIAAAAADGSQMEMEEAYDLACQMKPDIRVLLEQRTRAQQANAANASTQRARAAGGTMRTNPSGPAQSPQGGDDMAADFAAAVASFRR